MKIYFGNLWEGIISQSGIHFLEGKGFELAGNIFLGDRKKTIKDFNPDRIIYAPISNDPLFDEIIESKSKFILWSLFPDQNVGWSYKKNTYLYEPQSDFKKVLFHRKREGLVYTNSAFSKELLLKTYGKDIDIEVIYLGIDVNEVLKYKKKTNPKVKNVCWNHMWRSDKGFIDALKIIESLSKKYPEIAFNIGRRESWVGNDLNLNKMKTFYSKFLIRTKDRKNINILLTKNMQEYFKFISSQDICFSVSFHETFGIAMMESSLVSTIVVPDREAYLEVFDTVSTDVKKTMIELIENPETLKTYGLSNLSRSKNFDVLNTVKRIVEILSQDL